MLVFLLDKDPELVLEIPILKEYWKSEYTQDNDSFIQRLATSSLTKTEMYYPWMANYFVPLQTRKILNYEATLFTVPDLSNSLYMISVRDVTSTHLSPLITLEIDQSERLINSAVFQERWSTASLSEELKEDSLPALKILIAAGCFSNYPQAEEIEKPLSLSVSNYSIFVCRIPEFDLFQWGTNTGIMLFTPNGSIDQLHMAQDPIYWAKDAIDYYLPDANSGSLDNNGDSIFDLSINRLTGHGGPYFSRFFAPMLLQINKVGRIVDLLRNLEFEPEVLQTFHYEDVGGDKVKELIVEREAVFALGLSRGDTNASGYSIFDPQIYELREDYYVRTDYADPRYVSWFRAKAQEAQLLFDEEAGKHDSYPTLGLRSVSYFLYAFRAGEGQQALDHVYSIFSTFPWEKCNYKEDFGFDELYDMMKLVMNGQLEPSTLLADVRNPSNPDSPTNGLQPCITNSLIMLTQTQTATAVSSSLTISPNFEIGRVYNENMQNGLWGLSTGGRVWFGAYRHLIFSDDMKGMTLYVETFSKSYELRIEIWKGIIDPNDHEWWIHHKQVALSDGTGDSPVTVIDPKLIWGIEPGQYTLFFASNYDYILDYEISYSIDIKRD